MSNYLTGLAQLNPTTTRFDGGSTSYSLPVASTSNQTLVFINGVCQHPGTDYSVSGSTLTMSSTVPAGTNVLQVMQLFETGIVNTVADDTIGLAQLSASGTASSSTFLRGDNAWATAGKALQAVTATDSTTRTINSTSFITASNTLTVDITPSAASSKILVMVNTSSTSDSGSGIAFFTIYRDSTNLASTYGMSYVDHVNAVALTPGAVMFHNLDSPNTTSQVTYQMYCRNDNNSYPNYINLYQTTPWNVQSSITAIEIGA